MQDNHSTESLSKQESKKSKESHNSFMVVASLTLHTEIANKLFYATWERGNIGLVQFASQVAKIYKSSKADDPYADWYLMKIYDAIFAAKKYLKDIKEKTSAYFDNQSGLSLQYERSKPWEQQLRIVSPFSYMGASLLIELDNILRQIIIIRHVGVQTENEFTIKEPIKKLQYAFAVPFIWKDTKVTRDDVRSNNQKAISAKEKFKEALPDDVLNQKIDFSYLPNSK
jgi:integrating conjugative element protein (TIGR03761 family)